MTALVSVVVTTYNQAEFIEECVASALGQTYRHKEIIVVDDGSTDATRARLQKFKGDITYLGGRNLGVAAARNVGVAGARGEFVALLDGDDIWQAEKLEVQVDILRSRPESGLVAVDGVQFSGGQVLQGSLFGEGGWKLFCGPAASLATASCYEELLWRNFIATTSQVMIPSKVLAAVGASDTRFKLASDYDLYLRIASRWPITLCKRPLTMWRYHPGSASGPGPLRGCRWLEEDIEVLKKHWREASAEHRPVIGRALERRALIASMNAYSYGRRGHRAWAVKYLARLMAKGVAPGIPAAYCLGLWVPRSLASRCGWVVRQTGVYRTGLGE